MKNIHEIHIKISYEIHMKITYEIHIFSEIYKDATKLLYFFKFPRGRPPEPPPMGEGNLQSMLRQSLYIIISK